MVTTDDTQQRRGEDERAADRRRQFMQEGLREDDLRRSPFEQFADWFRVASESDIVEPNAMILATATADGQPSARAVLLKTFSADGFVFFTNYESRKGRELAENPRAALVFLWTALSRQVRITGTVVRLSQEDSAAYFHSRPVGSQIGTWASEQSRVIADRTVLEHRYEDFVRRFDGGEIPLPPFWGGFRVEPDTIEFWQGRPNRLHDRFQYSREADGSWTIARLAP